MSARYLALGVVLLLLPLTACAGTRPWEPAMTSAPSVRSAIGGLVFAYGVGARNVLDTSRGTFTKDMIVGSPLTVPMELTPGEMARIADKLEEIGFFSYPTRFVIHMDPLAEDGVQLCTPFASYRCAVRTSEGTKVVKWDGMIGTDDARALRLFSLADLIERIISARPEYKRLPEPRGMYM
ncbi:MAG: hypothetical protein WCP98_11455 [Actinomycetes bacterium]|jgi:hypothetical protein